jgi:hypothetical protein
MKVDKNKVLLWVCLAGLLSVLAVAIYFDDNRPAPPTPARIRYLRDSLEMEYYKKAIENSYPFDHSKIPTNESNP